MSQLFLNQTKAPNQSRVRDLIIAILISVVASFILTVSSASVAQAQSVVELSTPSTQAEIQAAINTAGTTPTKIVLGAGETSITSTLTIPNGADIELVSALDLDTTLARGFTGNMIHVQAGAKLTLDNNGSGILTVDSRGTITPTTSSTVLIEGSLTMNGGSIQGARGVRGTFTGAVTVKGQSASFTLNDGKVTDNERRQDTGATQNGAGNIAVTGGATFTMNGGEVSYGKGSSVTGNSYGEVGGIGVYERGIATINGGVISNNDGFAGALLGWSWIDGYALTPTTSAAKRGEIYINGGTIENNIAGFGGGGLLLFGNATAQMTGGEIINNKAPNGGGVNAMDLYVWGASGTWEEISGEGPHKGWTAEEYSLLQPAGFHMTGGLIANNSATRTGGGVNVISNAVNLEGGIIRDNYAAHQGGGIYVATKSYTVNLNNAAVYENNATHVGGGLWVCPTGAVELYVTNGGAIFDNTATNFGDDIAHDQLGSTVGSLPLWLSDHIVGGGEMFYHWDNQDARFDPANPGERLYFKLKPEDKLFNQGLEAVTSDVSKEAAKNSANLLIYNNKSFRGGGVGANGLVVFGISDSFDVTVKKAWVNALTGAPIEGPDAPRDSVHIGIYIIEETGNRLVQHGTITKANNWSLTLSDLCTCDGNQNTFQYIAIEIDDAGNPILDENGEYVASALFTTEDETITLTNNVMPEQTSISVIKKWEGTPADKVVVNLLADGNMRETVTLDASNEWQHIFEGLLKYNQETGELITYTISEEMVPGYTSTITGDAAQGFVITNTKLETPPEPQEPPVPNKYGTPQLGDTSSVPISSLALALGGISLVLIGMVTYRRLRKVLYKL